MTSRGTSGFGIGSVRVVRSGADDSRGPRYDEEPEPTRVPRIEPPCRRCATRKG